MIKSAWWLQVVLLGSLVGCQGGGESKTETDDSVPTDDTGTGGGNEDLWAATGVGHAWFVDGVADNSIFHLEMEQTRSPKEGEAYYGWVSKNGADPLPVGEIVISGESVVFEYDLEVNAVLAGYDTFEAWATSNGGSAPEGTQLWKGQVDPTIYASMQNLLVASPNTPDGEGSLRSLESYIENVNQQLTDTMTRTPDDLTVLVDEAEAVVNAVYGTMDDVDGDGTPSTYPFQFSIIGSGGYIELILTDISTVSAQVEPTNEIKDFGNYAYDCTELIENKTDRAASYADTATVAGAASSALSQLEKTSEQLGYALNGEDGDDEGEDIDPITEGALECAIFYVSEMMRMDVSVP